jgi:hypothetical protein
LDALASGAATMPGVAAEVLNQSGNDCKIIPNDADLIDGDALPIRAVPPRSGRGILVRGAEPAVLGQRAVALLRALLVPPLESQLQASGLGYKRNSLFPSIAITVLICPGASIGKARSADNSGCGICTRANSWNYICIADAFRARGLAGPKIALWSNDASLRSQLLAKGSFVTAMGKLNAQWYGLKVLPIELPVQPWPVVIATLRGRALSPAVELLIEFVRDLTKPMRAANGVVARRRPR